MSRNVYVIEYENKYLKNSKDGIIWVVDEKEATKFPSKYATKFQRSVLPFETKVETLN